MTELNKKVFGRITTKEIIGAIPPAIPDIKKLLDNEFQNLINELKSQTKDDLKKFETLKINFSILDNAKYKSLEVFGESPVVPGVTGKKDIFAPF